LLCLFSYVATGVKIEPMRHDIQQITAPNFDSVIGKFRADIVASIWFFKDTPEDKKFLDVYNQVAKEMKGMAKVVAISCDDWAVFCTKKQCQNNTINHDVPN